jgi:hypothetical protein
MGRRQGVRGGNVINSLLFIGVLELPEKSCGLTSLARLMGRTMDGRPQAEGYG